MWNADVMGVVKALGVGQQLSDALLRLLDEQELVNVRVRHVGSIPPQEQPCKQCSVSLIATGWCLIRPAITLSCKCLPADLLSGALIAVCTMQALGRELFSTRQVGALLGLL